MQKTRLYIDIEFDPAKGSAENIAQLLDSILTSRLLASREHEVYGIEVVPGVYVPEESTIAIVVEGGMIQSVLTDDPLLPIDVLVVDHDTEMVDEEELSTIDFPDDDESGAFYENVVILRGESVIHHPSHVDAIKKARASQVTAWSEEVDDDA